MTPVRKNWLKDNVMGIIIAVMFTAFWVQYENDRRNEIEEKKDMVKDQQRQCDQIKKLTMILLADPDTSPESKEMIRGFVKIESRGANIEKL